MLICPYVLMLLVGSFIHLELMRDICLDQMLSEALFLEPPDISRIF